MLHRHQLTPGLLYSLSPGIISQMHLEIGMAPDAANRQESPETAFLLPFLDRLLAFLGRKK